MLRSFVLATLATAALAAPAQAALMVDQDTILPVGVAASGRTAGVFNVGPAGSPGTSNDLVQTITAGIAGRLTTIELQAYAPRGTGGVFVSLYDGDAAVAGAHQLYQQYVAIADVPSTASSATDRRLLSFDVSAAAFDVAVGQQFSFRIDAANPRDEVGSLAIAIGRRGGPLLDYDGAQMKVSVDRMAFFGVGGDAAFRTTVDTAVSAVPEPAAWGFMLVGIGAAGGMMRRRLRTSERRFSARIGRIAAGTRAD